jgi:hypothetical protein
VLFLLFSVLLTQFSGTRPFASIIPLVYLVANLLASFMTVFRKLRLGNEGPLPKPFSLFSALYSLFLLSLVFVILHLSYGLGFLVGLIKFWNRWSDKVGKVPVFTIEPVG